jgi:enamine deaminase RidA (YjgF/YER057c/UK114 family)
VPEPLRCINPDTLATPEPTRTSSASPGTLVFVAGQVAEVARRAIFGDHKPADALIGVETLAEPGRLIEVEAFAVVSAPARSGGSGSR